MVKRPHYVRRSANEYLRNAKKTRHYDFNSSSEEARPSFEQLRWRVEVVQGIGGGFGHREFLSECQFCNLVTSTLLPFSRIFFFVIFVVVVYCHFLLRFLHQRAHTTRTHVLFKLVFISERTTMMGKLPGMHNPRRTFFKFGLPFVVTIVGSAYVVSFVQQQKYVSSLIDRKYDVTQSLE